VKNKNKLKSQTTREKKKVVSSYLPPAARFLRATIEKKESCFQSALPSLHKRTDLLVSLESLVDDEAAACVLDGQGKLDHGVVGLKGHGQLALGIGAGHLALVGELELGQGRVGGDGLGDGFDARTGNVVGLEVDRLERRVGLEDSIYNQCR